MLWFLVGVPAVAMGQGAALRLVDSVRVVESDSFMLGARIRMHPSASRYYIADLKEARIAEVDRKGRVLRLIGRKGSGPGEMRQPSSIATSGDTILTVNDAGQRRVVSWDLRTLKPKESFPLQGWFPQLRYDGTRLRAGVLQVDSGAAVTSFSTDGTQRVHEGVVPELIRRTPMFAVGFGGVFFADDGADTYAVYEVSNDLYSWKRGAKSATVADIPRVARQGVTRELFDRMLAMDPSKAGEIAYDRSIPMGLHRMSAGRLGLITIDGKLDQKRMEFSGIQHLTVIDVKGRRACADILVPTQPEPYPSLSFVADTLVVMQQGERSPGDMGTWIMRYVVDARACRWKPLPAPRPAP